jgi:hypothetical protein
MLPVVDLFRPSAISGYEFENRKGVPYITATNTGILHVNQHVMRILQLRNGSVFEFDFANPLENEGKVLQIG